MARNKPNFRQLKDKMFGSRSHELVVFLFFLAVSFGFWLLQSLNETLERDVQVEIELDNVPDDVVIIDSLPSSIDVTLQDRGLTLARHSISSLFRPNRIKIDFTEYETGQEDAEVHIFSSDIQRMLRRVFAASTKVQSLRPDTLRFAYNHGYSRTLPVKLEGTLKALPQNYIQSVSVEPDSVRVYASKAILNTMDVIYSEAFILDELHETGTYQIALRRQKALRCEPTQVSLKVNVGYYTEKTVRVPVIGLNFPADKKLRTFPAQVSVTFRVESGLYHRINAEDFVLATTYEELLGNTDNVKLPLHLRTVPEGVSNVRISPQEVDYLIEQVEAEENSSSFVNYQLSIVNYPLSIIHDSWHYRWYWEREELCGQAPAKGVRHPRL